MRQYSLIIVCSMMMAAGLGRDAAADLKGYLAKAEPAYHWELKAEKTLPGGKAYDLRMVSQTWQGHNWEHRLQIFIPDAMDAPEMCTLLNTGGSGGAEEAVLGLMAARASGSPFAIVYNNPMQPLYGGQVEDELIVYTWLKFIETGDETWPLHFPMAKTVIKAMDTIQAFTKTHAKKPIREFIITGASKRGWTTWLVGASGDKRVKAIAPMVIDILNVKAQIAHMIKSYGEASEQIDDYTSAGLIPILNSNKADRLMELEDPYSYRKQITMPKLILLGTNDRYWTQDALNLYWDGLVGPKWVAYIPNSGHGLEDRGRLLNTLTAFTRTIASGRLFPKIQWNYTTTPKGVRLNVTTGQTLKGARLFHVTAPTLDFRDQKWTFTPIKLNGKSFTATYDRPDSGYAAIYGELVFETNGKPYTLTTQIHILGKD